MKKESNLCHFLLPLTLMVWVSEEVWTFLHRIKHTHLAQDSEKLKEDPEAGGVVADLAAASNS